MTPTVPAVPLETAYWIPESVRVGAEYADHLMAEVGARADVERIEWELEKIEALPWCLVHTVDGKTEPLIGGKNEPTRDAQFVKWCEDYKDHQTTRAKLVVAKREHRLAVAQIEASRERVRTARAIVLALAPDRGMG